MKELESLEHAAYISTKCKTVEDALKFRAKNRVINLQGVK